MKHIGFIKQGLFFLGLFQAMSCSYAGTPVWTIEPVNSSTIKVPSNGVATNVQYRVTNQSNRTHTLVMSAIPGVSQITTGYNVCRNPFTLSGRSSCILTLQIDGNQASAGNTNGPVVCEQASTLQCYKPSPSSTLKVIIEPIALSTSLSNLALKMSGVERTITITSSGSDTVQGLSINYGSLPVGTTHRTTCGSSLDAGQTCTITVDPGSSPTSNCDNPYSAPTPSVITVSGNNASPVTINVYVLTYGCIYQEGYVYAIDDTTPASTSIGGTIASLADNSSPIQWGGPGSFIGMSYTDGAANTAQIVAEFGSGNYAANICANYTIDSAGASPCGTDTCFQDWYLPAICQLSSSGEPIGGLPNPCTGSSNTSTINMWTNLPNLLPGTCSGSTSCLTGTYWSSVNVLGYNAYILNYSVDSATGGGINSAPEEFSLNVRCSRALTP